MNFEHLAQYCDLALGALLIVKLLSLRLHRVYTIFCLFLAADLLGSALWFTRHWGFGPLKVLDYRLLWLGSRALVWVLTFWTVATLLSAILNRFPGILRMSRDVFRYCWIGALLVGLLSALPEYSLSGLGEHQGWMNHALSFGIISERVVSSISLLALLAMLAFLLWFPVEIPRNLAVFSVGFVIYFAIKTMAYLARSLWSHEMFQMASVASSLGAAACFAYWAFFISRAGEVARSTLNIRWESDEQERLMQRLEVLNESLLRAARR